MRPSAFPTVFSPGRTSPRSWGRVFLLATAFRHLCISASVSEPDTGPCLAATTRGGDLGSESPRSAPGARGLVSGRVALQSLWLAGDKCSAAPQAGTESDGEADAQPAPCRGLRGSGDPGSETPPDTPACATGAVRALGGERPPSLPCCPRRPPSEPTACQAPRRRVYTARSARVRAVSAGRCARCEGRTPRGSHRRGQEDAAPPPTSEVLFRSAVLGSAIRPPARTGAHRLGRRHRMLFPFSWGRLSLLHAL